MKVPGWLVAFLVLALAAGLWISNLDGKLAADREQHITDLERIVAADQRANRAEHQADQAKGVAAAARAQAAQATRDAAVAFYVALLNKARLDALGQPSVAVPTPRRAGSTATPTAPSSGCKRKDSRGQCVGQQP